MGISVVIPCYRSRDSLPILVPQLTSELAKLTDDYEVILVVDGSPDDTFAVAYTLAQQAPEHVRAVLLNRNYGQGNATVAGVLRARYPITVTMDDDLQHLPAEIATLVQPLENPLIDLVYGHAIDEEHSFFRNVGSQGLKMLLGWTGVPDAQDMSAFRAFRTHLRDGFAHSADFDAAIDVLLSWTTTAITHVDVEMSPRPAGESGYSLAKLVRTAFNIITGYSTAPLKFVTWLGGLSATLGLVMLIKVIAEYAFGHTDVDGWTSLAAMLALFSGSIMLSLGIIGEYLGRLHFRSMQKPTYLTRVDTGLTGPRVGRPGVAVPSIEMSQSPASVAVAQQARHEE